MALGFKKSGVNAGNLGMLGGLGIAALGGPIAPLILASLYSAQKGEQDERDREAVRESAQSRVMGGFDPMDATGGEILWNPEQPSSGFKQVMRETQGPTQSPQAGLPAQFDRVPMSAAEMQASDQDFINRQRQDAMTAFPQLAAQQRVAALFPGPEEFGDAKEVTGPDGQPAFASFGKRGGVRTYNGVQPPKKEESVELVNAFDMLTGRPLGAVNKRALDRLAAKEPGRYIIGDKMPGARGGARPPTAEEMKLWKLDPTGSYGIDPETGKPFVITQPKQATPTEGQQNAAYNASRIADAIKSIGDIVATDPGAATSAWLEGTEGIPYVSALGRFAASDNQQIFRNNMADAVDAIITLGTGAAYTGEQKIAARNAYLPQTGDSEKVRQEKYRKLVNVYNAAREKARAAGADLPEPVIFEKLFAPKAPSPGVDPQAQPIARQYIGYSPSGKRVYVENGQQYEED